MHALTSCWATPLAHMTIKFRKTRLQLCAQVGVTRRDGEAPRRRRAGAAAARLDVRQRPAPLRQRVLPAVSARHAAMLCTLKRAQELLCRTAPTVNAHSPPSTMEKAPDLAPGKVFNSSVPVEGPAGAAASSDSCSCALDSSWTA